MPRGKHAGNQGGRPKGSKAPHTLKAAEARKHYVERVVKNLDPILNAHLLLAKGLTFIFKIVEVGKGKEKRKEKVLVQDPDEIKEALDKIESGDNGGDEGYYFITTKAPDGKALEYLSSQAIGKPKESVELSGKDGKPIEVKEFKSMGAEQLNEQIKKFLNKK